MKTFLKLIALALIIALGVVFFYVPHYFLTDVSVELSEESDGSITVMSTNVRFYNPLDFLKQSWFYRASLIVDDINSVKPDIIGFQEATFIHYDYLKKAMPDYSSEMAYRDDFILSEGCPVFYRTDKFELVDSEFGTYPEFIEGYEGSFNDVRSKSWNLGVFRIKENGEIFVFATTHLWWKQSPSDGLFSQGSSVQAYSDEAREYQLELLTQKVDHYRKKYNCPAIVVGDMNTHYNSKAIQTAFANGFRHAHDIATDFSEQSVGYHNCFPWGYENKYFDTPFESAIDHILVIGEKEGAVKRFERYSPDYYFPISDHSAAYIDIEL